MSITNILPIFLLVFCLEQSFANDCKSLLDNFFLKKSKTIKELRRKIKENIIDDIYHPSQKTLDFFDTKNLMISTTTPFSLRKIIVKQGSNDFSFKNMFQNGGTSMANETVKARVMAEAHRMGQGLIESLREDNLKNKPYYGYLMFKNGLEDSEQAQMMKLDRYGEDIWVFKTEDVVANTSFTIGDSMHRYLTANPLAYQNYKSFMKNTSKLNSEYFLPYKDMQKLLAAHLERNLSIINAKANLAKPYQGWDVSDQLDRLNYYEVQLFPGDELLSLDNIQEYYFTKSPPSIKFLGILKTKGIIVYDWRGEKPKIYK